MPPLYDFACDAGHLTEKLFAMKDVRPKTVKCGSCKRRARRVFSKASVVDDFPEHFNVSMGLVVKNRAHHKQLQRELQCQDWEPTRNSPGSQLVADRLRRTGGGNF